MFINFFKKTYLFRKLNGYHLLEDIFKARRCYANSKNQEFLLSAFELLEIMICENKVDLITDYDAFHLLLCLTSNSQQFEIISKSLDLLKVNY